MNKPQTVEEYINNSPADIQKRLRQFRKLILSVVPKGTEEKISYGMPFYDYKGRLVYFAAQKYYVGLYIPPPIIENHSKDLRNYTTTKSAIHFPNDKPISVELIKKLLKARIEYNGSN